MKIIRILPFLLALLIFAPAALAQTGGQESPGAGAATATPATGGAVLAQPIRLDTPLTISLSGTTPVGLSYKSAGNETLSITARSLEAEDVLDPLLTVQDAGGAQIASNDDHRTSRTDLAPRDSLVAGLVLAAAGRYTIQVASVDANAQGSVEVLVTSGGAAPPEEAPSETISDRVPDNNAYSHDFVGSAGEIVTISVRATDNQLDPTVSLRDSSGSEIASNDDQTTDPALGPYDSQIANFALPETGTYTIQITGFAGLGGTFDLTIARGGTRALAATPTPEPTITPDIPTPTQQIIKGTVYSGDVYTYAFDANAGDVYTITVVATSSDFDPRVSVYFNDDYIADNDDYGSSDPNLQSTDSRIYNLIIHETGSYDIDVRGYSDSEGDFALTIDPVATDAPTGQPVEAVELGTVDSGEIYSYSFEAEAGDYISLTVRNLTLGFDPYITLLDADGTVLFDNDNEGSTYGDYAYFDAKIPNFRITESGTYTVEVSGVQGSSGTFGLTIGTLR